MEAKGRTNVTWNDGGRRIVANTRLEGAEIKCKTLEEIGIYCVKDCIPTIVYGTTLNIFLTHIFDLCIP